MIWTFTAAAVLGVVAVVLFVPTVWEFVIGRLQSFPWCGRLLLGDTLATLAAALLVIMPIRNRFHNWNTNREPTRGRSLAIILLVSVVVTVGLWAYWLWAVVPGQSWAKPCRIANGVFVAYVLIDIVGAGLWTHLLVEFNRWLYSDIRFRQYGGHFRRSPPFYTADPPQLRFGPRIEPIVTGFIERVLLTTLSLVVLVFAKDPNNSSIDVTALIGIAGGYVGLKAIKRLQAISQTETMAASIHSLWGSTVSVGFAVFGGWLFSQIVY